MLLDISFFVVQRFCNQLRLGVVFVLGLSFLRESGLQSKMYEQAVLIQMNRKRERTRLSWDCFNLETVADVLRTVCFLELTLLPARKSLLTISPVSSSSITSTWCSLDFGRCFEGPAN